MIQEGVTVCPYCGSGMKIFDRVVRKIKGKRGIHREIVLRRVKCDYCKSIHRVIPIDIYPFKHYEYEIIQGVIEGFITVDTYGFEDNPCEQTMKRWLREKNNSFNEDK